MSAHDPSLSPEEVSRAKKKRIWTVAGILALVTAVEFAFAFGMEAGMLRTSIFLILTVFKAFYIVADFMHLKHEIKSLVYSIILPLVFVVWLVVALLQEGGAIANAIINF